MSLSQAAWHRTCETTFALADHPQGISLKYPGFPGEVDEEEAALLWWVEEMAVLDIQPKDFEPAVSGNEMFAWLEHSLQGGQLH
ncbi:hypothetical protein [Ramlibacter sp. AN1133]|uniref:hypothetical protein n=1 Tax=Ramlibacter sp. AN1133 TaxID=3133429 RepID=UPI0030C50C34